MSVRVGSGPQRSDQRPLGNTGSGQCILASSKVQRAVLNLTCNWFHANAKPEAAFRSPSKDGWPRLVLRMKDAREGGSPFGVGILEQPQGGKLCRTT